jgi:hypothetical protein
LVELRLSRFGLSKTIIETEISAMARVIIGPTVDRSVIGIMVDFTRSASYFLEDGMWDDTYLPSVEDRLAENPCYAGRSLEETIFPESKAPELLLAKWGAG